MPLLYCLYWSVIVTNPLLIKGRFKICSKKQKVMVQKKLCGQICNACKHVLVYHIQFFTFLGQERDLSLASLKL